MIATTDKKTISGGLSEQGEQTLLEKMANNKTEQLNVKNATLLIGTILGALISFAANGTFLSIIGGVIGGLIFAAIFNSVILPYKSSDR